MKLYKEIFKIFTVDEILRKHRHVILHCHPTNPTLILQKWCGPKLKNYIAQKKVTFKTNDVFKLVKHIIYEK